MLLLLFICLLSSVHEIYSLQWRLPVKTISTSAIRASIIGPNEVESIRSVKPIVTNSQHTMVTHDGVTLPPLTMEDELKLRSNQRLQNQKHTGRQGYGWVAVDVRASPDEVFSALEDFKGYQERIPTVRSAKILSHAIDTTVVEFSLSRFKLPVNVLQTVYKKKRLIRFKLDPSRPNPVVSKVEGFWYVGSSDREDYSRVWLYANLVVSKLVPTFIVEYAAARALPRATEWLQSYFPNSEIVEEA